MVLVTERFTALANSVRRGRRKPDLPMVVLPLNPQFYAEGEIEPVVAGVIDEFVHIVAPTLKTGQGAP